MTGWVVDASVMVKWLVREEHSDEAAGLLNGGSTFVAPALVFAEAANALWAMHRHGGRSGGRGGILAGGTDLAPRFHAPPHRRCRAASGRPRPPGL